ncbi:GNAT family N-acetyltransferase [uncultured Mailhella sp.]|uniref:GNAT family N-acetyltransferase n=1 Tax=uncultured Mailhella sp. TaxID=1981031 RepID=UPI0025F03B2F|nr:GNAT family N-acetyltransferase [uncultured Mailhella sp.]
MLRWETPRLVLRTFEEKDAPALLALFHRPQVHCFREERLEDFGEALAGVRRKSREREGTQLAVCLKESDGMIGNVFSRQEGPDTWSVGWAFDRRFQGRGYAGEAARAYVDFLFSCKGARRIFAYVEEDNLPSRRLCERLGMRQEARFEEFISFVKDEQGRPVYENTLVYAVLKKEWKAASS